MTSLSRTLARIGTLGAFFATGAATALAQVPTAIQPAAPEGAVQGSIEIKDIIGLAATYLLSLAGGLAVLFLVVGGILYTTAGGSDEKVQKARKYMTNALVGLVVVVLAFVIVGNTLGVVYRLNSDTGNTVTVSVGGAQTVAVTCSGTCVPVSSSNVVATASMAGTSTVVVTGVGAGTATITVANGTPGVITVTVQ